jgi:hypothetical protein
MIDIKTLAVGSVCTNVATGNQYIILDKSTAGVLLYSLFEDAQMRIRSKKIIVREGATKAKELKEKFSNKWITS